MADIRSKAMLISLSISYWTGKAADESVVDEITKRHKTERDVHDYKKVLIHPDAINKVKAARSRARTYYFDKTLPWLDGGTRVLPMAFHSEFVAKMHEFKGEYEEAVAELCKAYPGLKGEARKRLGDLYRDEDYPTTESLRRKFGFETRAFPIPSKEDWRIPGLSEKDKAQTDKAVKEALEVATRDLWKRLYAVVEALAERMKASDTKFRDSIVGNIKELCAVMEAMNVADDPKLSEMTKKIGTELGKLDAGALREDPKARKKVKDAADEILAKMAGYIGKD